MSSFDLVLVLTFLSAVNFRFSPQPEFSLDPSLIPDTPEPHSCSASPLLLTSKVLKVNADSAVYQTIAFP